MASVSISVSVRWKWRKGTGSACRICNARTWLRERILEYRIDCGDYKPMKNVRLCQSCGEALENANNG